MKKLMEDTINYVNDLPDDEFRYLFARTVGWISEAAETDPGAICRLDEVAGLFEALYDRMQGRKYETPAGGAAGESR